MTNQNCRLAGIYRNGVAMGAKNVPDDLRLKEEYVIAKCCLPTPTDKIVGYFSHDRFLKVHRVGCPSLNKVEAARLVPLEWKEILIEKQEFQPDDDYQQLDKTDFAVLKHHLEYGIDYSLMVAKMVRVGRQEAFDRHTRLTELGLLERVEPRMVQYRKGVVDNKWIKHRNHTYYRLTPKGMDYVNYYLSNV